MRWGGSLPAKAVPSEGWEWSGRPASRWAAQSFLAHEEVHSRARLVRASGSSQSGDVRKTEMSRFDELTATAMALAVFGLSYGVLAAVLYAVL
jgi:hypothetical protein